MHLVSGVEAPVASVWLEMAPAALASVEPVARAPEVFSKPAAQPSMPCRPLVRLRPVGAYSCAGDFWSKAPNHHWCHWKGIPIIRGVTWRYTPWKVRRIGSRISEARGL